MRSIVSLLFSSITIVLFIGLLSPALAFAYGVEFVSPADGIYRMGKDQWVTFRLRGYTGKELVTVYRERMTVGKDGSFTVSTEDRSFKEMNYLITVKSKTNGKVLLSERKRVFFLGQDDAGKVIGPDGGSIEINQGSAKGSSLKIAKGHLTGKEIFVIREFEPLWDLKAADCISPRLAVSGTSDLFGTSAQLPIKISPKDKFELVGFEYYDETEKIIQYTDVNDGKLSFVIPKEKYDYYCVRIRK
ncbi:hypothetical protein [Bdellovibrio sp. HCB209]|uniref:hypothetical protein n=1 Tax=Bdellovibrio sp. HCB209 TaxID=3394354 RepID=UPI0039B61695